MNSFEEQKPETDPASINENSGDTPDKRYKEVFDYLKTDGFELTVSEAAYLRQVINECFEENNKAEKFEKETDKESMDYLFTFPEILERFFGGYYGIKFHEFIRDAEKKGTTRRELRKKLFVYIQTKLRKDKEMI